MSAVFGIAAIAGPCIGGAIVKQTTWRWCFWINLPLGFVAVTLCAFLVKTPTNTHLQPLNWVEKLRQFDIVGTIILIGSLVCLLLGLQWGGVIYPWNNGRIIALLVAAAVLAVAFVLLQIPNSRAAQTIPSSIISNRSVWMAGGYGMCITGGVYVAMLYVPMWFQVIQQRSALGSSVMLTPLIAGYVICSIISGILTSVIGYYNPSMILGTILAACGSGLLTTITPRTSIPAWIGYLALYGLGVGLGFGQPSYVVQTLLPEKDVSIGVTLITLLQNLSATIFVAVAQTVFQNTLASQLHAIVPDISASSLSQIGATQLVEQFSESELPDVLDGYSTALARTLYLSLGLSCASAVGAAFTEWKSMKPSKATTNSQEQK